MPTVAGLADVLAGRIHVPFFIQLRADFGIDDLVPTAIREVVLAAPSRASRPDPGTLRGRLRA